MNGGESDTVVEEDPTPTTRTTTEENNKNSDRNNKENVNLKDPELFSCLLQPASADSDPGYIGIRRLLLFRKAESGVCSRMVLFPRGLLVFVFDVEFWMFSV